jgi:hypothetical protein
LRDTLGSSEIGLGWADSPTIGGHAYTHEIVIMPTVYGDANLDGTANFSDLGILLSHYNTLTTGTWSWGDFNYDGNVNFSDLGILLSHYNHASGLGIVLSSYSLDSQAIGALSAAGFNTSEVPEPSSIVMLATLATAAGLWSVRRRRNRVA